MKMAEKKIPTDEGWAWVILVAAYIIVFFATSKYISGVYNVVFLEEFNQSKTVTAWCIGLHFSSPTFGAPIGSILMETVGCRITVYIGAAMIMVGYVSSGFVHSFSLLFFTYGLLAGLGVGLAYIPGMVMVGLYFKKYRNLAYGVVSTSAGFGTMLLAPLTDYLIFEYGWRGCMIITGGLIGHYFVAGSVLVPVDADSFDNEEMINNDTMEEKQNSVVDLKVTVRMNSPKSDHGNTITNMEDNISPSNASSISHGLNDEPSSSVYPQIQIQSACESKQLHVFSLMNRHQKLLNASEHTGSHPAINSFYRTESNDNQEMQAKFNSVDNFQAKGLIKESNSRNNPKSNFPEYLLTGISSDLVAVSYTSMQNLSQKRKKPIELSSKLQETQHLTSDNTDDKVKTSLLHKYKPLLNLPFAIFLINLYFINFGISCAYVHLPAFIIETGATKSQASSLLSVMAIASILSRLMTGIATNNKAFDVFVVHFGTCGISGIILCIGAVSVTNFYGQTIFVFLLGMYCNSFVVLMAPIAIALLGIDSLNIAYGVELFVCGFGHITGPPLAGLLYDLTGTYVYSLIIAGAAYLIGAFITMLLPVFSPNWRQAA